MTATRYIRVMVPTNIEFGRQILLGARRYCNEHPGTRIDLFGMAADLRTANTLPDAACVITSANSIHEIEQIAAHNRVVVVTSNRFSIDDYSCVLNDDVAVGRMGAEYLLSLGYRQFVFLSKQSFNFSVEREAGFTAAVRRTGAAVRVHEDFKSLNAREVAEELQAMSGQIGIMAASDMMARWLIEAFDQPDRQIPDRFAILGVDDDPLETNLSPIEISSVRLSGERLGYEAAALGMRLAAGGKPPGQTVRIAPTRVVPRRSTSKLAVEDPMVLRALRLIRDRMGDLADVADVVAGLGINRRVLEKRFRGALNSSIARELANARIQRARELLGTTDLTVKEISFLVGLSEPRMLTLVFQRATGESPSGYRSRVRPGS